jgi:hypothetical protein
MAIKFLQGFKDKIARIKRLPVYVKETSEIIALKKALGVVIAYQTRIKSGLSSVKKLHPFSIDQKKKSGFSKPNVPLYGAGDSMSDTLYNLLEIHKPGERYEIKFSNKTHHDSRLSIAQIHYIHENGSVIKVTEKMRAFLHFAGLHLKPTTKIIRIPPRPVYKQSLKVAKKNRRKKNYPGKIRAAIAQLITTGKDTKFKKLQKLTPREELAKEAMV